MFRAQDIRANLLHLVGWQQNYDTLDFMIANSLTSSESGLFFQQFHPLLTLPNIKAAAPDFKNIVYATYSNLTTYPIGARVTIGTKHYKALVANTDKNPVTETTYWEEFTPFSEWLENKTQDGIIKVISQFTTNKLAIGAGKSVIENKILFDGAGRISELVPNQSSFVGFELIPIKASGAVVKINKIGTQFTGTGNLAMYLMHSSKAEPVKVINFEISKTNSFEWHPTTDVFLPYSNSEVEPGSWYLIYDQTKLPEGVSAIRKDKDWGATNCISCTSANVVSNNLLSRYLEVHPFKVASIGYAEQDLPLWDIENNMYNYETNFGLNLDLTVVCDITEFILSNRGVFANAIALQVTCDLLREMAFNANTRVNRTTLSISKNDILYELDGDSTSLKKSGLGYKLEQAYKAIEVSTKGLDRVCLPCNNGGLKYRTV